MILDLTAIYDEQPVAKFCPQFNSVSFLKKSKLVPKLPECFNEIEFNETYTSTKSGKPFLCSHMELKNLFICYASEIGINNLANSKNWFF